MSFAKFSYLGFVSCLLLGGCHNITNECPKVSQWWYHAYPDNSSSAWETPDLQHDPSTAGSLGGHGRK